MSARWKGLLVVLAAIAVGPATKADEDSVKLKPGDNLDIVEQNCAACHSLDYIQMNSPFLDQKGWQAEVAKMVNAFKAPITEADQQKIIDYLSTHYAKE
jgi:sulfite dehydrogenase (cytochrome) subunit B